MNELSVALENCYGIKKLHHTFDFSEHRVFVIYAPNGSMKSSLAQTFQDVADGSASRDRVFPARACARKICDEGGLDLVPASVVVIRPYDQDLGHSEKTSTLLVDSKLRKEYESLHRDIYEAKGRLVEAMREQSGSKKNIEKEISLTFTKSESDLFRALRRIKDELADQKSAPFADVNYDRIFDEKVVALLNTKDFKTAIESYIKKYNELLAASTYFKKGKFTYYNAATIAKNLAANGFFDVKHSVTLHGDTSIVISTQQELEDLISKEKEAISSDKELRKKFLEIEKVIQKNETVREFEAYLAEHEEILPHLVNIDSFKEEIWKSYLKSRFEIYSEVVKKFEAVEKRKQEIEEEANKQRTAWESVIEIFNERFFVPFKLVARNKVSVMLGQDPILAVEFEFHDAGQSAPVDRGELMKVLSTGERKALYLLNVIFEVEVRRKASQETLFLVDDVADSFDYKNKYAIIQYLQEMSEDPRFRQILLTHNFDFLRTVGSRFVKYSHCLTAMKSSAEVTLLEAKGFKNVFVNDWKRHFFDDSRKRLASIPFIRNLVEYTRGEGDANYQKLTALLHWKANTSTVTQGELDQIYSNVFGQAGAWGSSADLVVDSLFAEAANCLAAGVGTNFENKIVLSIAIRLQVEKFMASRINDPAFLARIVANQTRELAKKFKNDFPGDKAAAELLDRVNLMTPENIHLNSFMYEPILDMSDDHLRKLYVDVSALK